MPRYRDALPQQADALFLTDGGLETSLIYHGGFELPEFAAFVLLDDDLGRQALRSYYGSYADIAAQRGTGFVLESPTYRASDHWTRKLGLTPAETAAFNRRAIDLMRELRTEYEDRIPHIVMSGCIGPAGDAYSSGGGFSEAEAEEYHLEQIVSFADTDVDLVTAFTIPNVEEAIGISRAARAAGVPAVIGFTVETDGRLPSGQGLRDAVEQVDEATAGSPAYYMINCAHPTHFMHVLSPGSWVERIRAVRANASSKSHAELDSSDTLDDGDPVQLGSEYLLLRARLPNLRVVGGCCGTDHRHVEHACDALQQA